jgi:hypothetical protein
MLAPAVRLLTELMPTLAQLLSNMRLGAALRAPLLPGLLNGLFDLRFGGSGSAKSDYARLIGLLNSTLRMDAAQ